MMHAGAHLIHLLEAQGVPRVFTVPGESFLAALDGLHGSAAIDMVICRHEGGAAMMAEATGKLTGRPGIAFVTRGPGSTNASAGVHVGRQDSTPMILFVGMPPVGFADREAFQEFDLEGFFGAIAKDVRVLRSADRMAETVSWAFHRALSGRPGPVVVGLPEDVLSAPAALSARARADGSSQVSPISAALTGMSGTAADDIAERIAAAERPFILVGGPGWSSAAARQLDALAQLLETPVATSFRCQDYIDNGAGVYAGHLGIGAPAALVSALRDADLLVVIGARLGEMTTGGYARLEVPTPAMPLIHIHPDADEIGTVYRPTIGLACASRQALDQLLLAGQVVLAEAPGNIGTPERQQRICELHDAYVASTRPERGPGSVQLGEIVRCVNETAPDAIICNGAGNYAAWVHRHHQFSAYRTQLAPTSGSMGYGVPAAIAAALHRPDCPVVCYAGDGCFMMTASELATIRQYGLRVIVIVANNGMYGTIRMHQESIYPQRIAGTTLVNPDFVALAGAHGGRAWRVSETAAFAPCFTQALAHDGLSLIELTLDPDAITPTATLQDLRGS